MPLYPYRCTQCGHRFEKIQRFNDEPEKVCPKCGGALERPLTAPGLQFKGAGWYVNDYAPKSSGAGAEGTLSGDKAEKKPATESKTESTKPDTASTASSGKADAASSAPAAAPSAKKD